VGKLPQIRQQTAGRPSVEKDAHARMITRMITGTIRNIVLQILRIPVRYRLFALHPSFLYFNKKYSLFFYSSRFFPGLYRIVRLPPQAVSLADALPRTLPAERFSVGQAHG